MEFTGEGQLEPVAREGIDAPSARFAATCPFSPAAPDEDSIAAERWPDAPHRDPYLGRFRNTWVGHAEPDMRESGSSGGMATWIAAELLRQGLVDGVAHVVPTPAASGRLFAYTVSRRVAALRLGAKSRYYPVDISEVLNEIRRTPGTYAVVGIPCFIKAVQLARRTEPVLAQRIAVTIGLFCGHMKSARMTESFAVQMGLAPPDLAAIDYRHKDPTRPANWYTARLTAADGSVRQRDWWNLSEGDWGSGFFMNRACGYCDDVTAECADVALGDAWLEPWASDGRGTNVVVVRSALVEALIAGGIGEGRLSLERVEPELVRETQAAGFRQRREGLAWRLARLHRRAWLWKPPVLPRKRVAPSAGQPLRRRWVYRLRDAITCWSPRVYRLAKATRQAWIYRVWARAMLAIYQAVTWSRGPIGAWLDRCLPTR